MEILTQTELKLRFDEIIEKIIVGAVFIHPTDTIYGLGGNAENKKTVEKIRRLKHQYQQPLSVWVPSLDWVRKNCVINQKAEEELKKLPGPYTIIIKLKNKKAVAENVILGKDTLGIRLPNHWLSHLIKEAGVPIVTTSANKTGQQFMTSLKDLDPEIESEIEFMIYEGGKSGQPSKIINLIKGEVKER